MKASTFIKVAILAQMQEIANLGLWFHLGKLIPSAVELLAHVTQQNRVSNDGEFFPWPDSISTAVARFYDEYAPEYSGKYTTSKEFFLANPTIFLASDEEDLKHHLCQIDTGEWVVYVPQLFEDLKAWCLVVLSKIEGGEINDMVVLKIREI